jgi:hypothetical protein
LPLEPGGKRPLVAWSKFQQRRPSASELRYWWRRWPNAGLGLVTGAVSGLVVLDVDPRNDGDATLEDLECEHGPVPVTVEVLTGGGGRHLYFQHPGEETPPVKIGPGLDRLGDGSQVVAPPSLHASGRRYEWRSPGCPMTSRWPSCRRGCVPMCPDEARRMTTGPRPATDEDRAVFVELWAAVGVVLEPGTSTTAAPSIRITTRACTSTPTVQVVLLRLPAGRGSVAAACASGRAKVMNDLRFQVVPSGTAT